MGIRRITGGESRSALRGPRLALMREARGARRGPRSPVRLQLEQDLVNGIRRPFQRQDTRAGTLMSASAVARHQIADRRFACAVEDAVPDGGDDAVVRWAPVHAQRDVRLREERVDEKAISGRKPFHFTQVGHHDVVEPKTVALQKTFEILLLAADAFDALLNLRLLEHSLDGHGLQPLDEFVEIALEVAQSGAAVDGVAEK